MKCYTWQTGLYREQMQPEVGRYYSPVSPDLLISVSYELIVLQLFYEKLDFIILNDVFSRGTFH